MNQVSLEVPVDGVKLTTNVCVPKGAKGIVLFVHGSGSGRLSPRNRYVAEVLNAGGLGTVLADLLTSEEDARDCVTNELRFDIPLLANRVVGLTDWISRAAGLKELGLGYFGASTGAAAALVAAAQRPNAVRAIVSRGGRPDLAKADLKRVTTPVLFLVGAKDANVLEMNRTAMEELPADTERKLEIIPGASHLFEEPGTLKKVAELARDWFKKSIGSNVPRAFAQQSS